MTLKVGYETLVSDSSGRNAAGDTVIDVINKKVKALPFLHFIFCFWVLTTAYFVI